MNDPSSPPAAAALPALRETTEAEAIDKLKLCERRIGHVFRDKLLLHAALTHASGAGHRLASNERLEFLGDAILGTIVCELLFHQFPDYLEGDLTRIKSVVVSRQTCAKIGEALRLQECLFVGKGVLSSPVVPPSLLADAFESLVAAVYLDGGMEAARRFVTTHIVPEVGLAAAEDFSGNYKSYLQQLAQREYGVTPTYQLLDEQGPDHSKCFLVAAVIGSNAFEPAWGRNKKEAEQRAACNALTQLSAESLPPAAD